MFSKNRRILVEHLKNNANRYFLLFMAFIVGVSAGAFTVNGLSSIQTNELSNYFQGFLQLMDNQTVNSNELLRISIMENTKIVILIWILGVTIIGAPFIFLVIGIRGFITGFCSGFIIKIMGIKGVLFTIFGLFPKEVIVIPCIIALGVNGINFSINIIKNKSIKHMLRNNLKTRFAGYCLTTLFYVSIMFIGILIEAYITPVFIRMIIPVIIN